MSIEAASLGEVAKAPERQTLYLRSLYPNTRDYYLCTVGPMQTTFPPYIYFRQYEKTLFVTGPTYFRTKEKAVAAAEAEGFVVVDLTEVKDIWAWKR